MTLVRWSPAHELASMEIERLDRMFKDLFEGRGRSWQPAVDVYETPNREVVLEAELPDMKREDINVAVENQVLTISGERKRESRNGDERLYRRERPHGAFSRSFTLPATVDAAKISASYKDGLLTVRVPQRDEAKPKQIAVE